LGQCGLRHDTGYKRRANSGGGAGEPDAADHLSTGDAIAVAQREAIAVMDDQHCLQQPQTLQLGYRVSDVGFADGVTKTLLGDRRDLGHGGLAVA
jgi:hypothetical protein